MLGTVRGDDRAGRRDGAGRAPLLGFVAALLLAATGADEPGRRPIPDAPQQGRPWTPPETRLARFLVTATESLFAQGVADPRGCEYREVEIAPPTWAWSGAKPTPAHAFVLPAVAGDDRRFAVNWDGHVVRLATIGPESDLAADVRDRAEALRQGREEAANERYGRPGTAFWRRGPRRKDGTAESGSPMQVCLLLRLGRDDLAESLFAAATPWTADGPRPDLTDYSVSYLTLANEWADDLYVRGADAHGHGDDAQALDAFRRLDAFRDAASTKADAMGFARQPGRGPRGGGQPTYFPNLSQLDELLADQERRAKEPPRGPIPGPNADPDARVAALILNLDQIAEHQMMSPGGAYPGRSPLVQELIAIGDPAVEPLLDALVHDFRLTRSLSYGRGMDQYRHISPTFDAIIPALRGLMKSDVPTITPEMRRRSDPEGRRALAAAYSKFWEANQAVPLAERHYRTLADDVASDRWLGAAGALTAPAPDASGRPRFRAAGQPPLPALGEPLREGRDPSLTALMIRRTEELARRSPDPSGLARACEMAQILQRWDPPAALPVLGTMMDGAIGAFGRNPRTGDHAVQSLAGYIARFTLIRSRAGDIEALDQYAAWIRTTTPESLDDARLRAFEPMWTEPDRPAIAEASRAMFADPNSPWRAAINRDPGQEPFGHPALETSPLIRVPAFREAVLDALADQSEVGTVERRANSPGSVSYKVSNSEGGFSAATMADLDALPVGETRTVRACDWLAWRLARLDGAPRFEVYWPQPRRDAAIANLAAFLRRFGDHFEAAAPVERASPFESHTRLAFPRLDHPATPADVEAGRALFSLEGQGGEVRLVSLPEVPLTAVWTTLEDSPLVYQTVSATGESQVRRDFDRSGRVWQAEEVRVGDHWERYFGFVGPHTVGRAPAGEVKFPESDHHIPTVPEGKFGVRLTLPDPPEDPEAGFRPGAPMIVAVHLRNLTGLNQAAPTEFIRPADDGRPALRPGIRLQLWRSDVSPTDRLVGDHTPREPEEQAPERDARFTPGEATSILGPAASSEAFRLDLPDWFDLSRPGQYGLAITLDEGAGVDAGNPGHLYFRLRE